jgi:TPR repeat protein
VGIGIWLSPGGGPEAVEQPAAVSTSFTPAAMKAAEEGNVEAQFMVGSALLADAETNLAYSTKALGFLQQAAEHGHGRAMLRLGIIYKKGIDAPQNYGLAAKWIEKAALLGEPQGMLELGRLYREGVGMPQDMVKAYVWLNRAAAARDIDAPRERGEVARLLTPTELRHAQDATLAKETPAGDR